MRRFVGELGRRRVFRTAALYLIVAVVVVEATEALMAPLGLSLRVLSMITWGAILGFPIAVGLAWAFDVTPRGIVRTPPDSEEERRRRKISAQIGLRLTLTGVAAAAVGATTWVIMEPFLPAVAETAPPSVVDPPLRAEVLVSPVVTEGDVDADAGGRATLLLLQSLSGASGLEPVDPRRAPEMGGGEHDVAAVARKLGVGRVVEARLTSAPEGVVFLARVRDLARGVVEDSAAASGPSGDLEALVTRVVDELVAARAGGDAGSPD